MTRRQKKITKLKLEIESLRRQICFSDRADVFLLKAAIQEKEDILFELATEGAKP